MADEDAARIEALVAQAGSSNDVDTKVDALSKLENEFQQGTKINDPENILNVLKSALRTSNQHLTAAAVSVVPPLLPLLVSHPSPATQIPSPTASTSTSSIAASSSMEILVLRHVLHALLPSGGLIERLGDREKIQQKAHESLVILGGFVFRCGGSSKSSKAETPLMTFERFLREAGFASKVWKVREHSILVLAEIRKQHHLFPLKPYLPLLVTLLEDTDPHVRDCARKSVVEIFSGPGVTDHARADLKKEMSKKGVRKTIVDSVLAQLLAGSTGSASPPGDESENGDAKPGYIPPSLALQNHKASAPVPVRTTSGASASRPTSIASRIPSRPQSRAGGEPPSTPTTEATEISSVYIASSKDLEQEFASMEKVFEGRESEHNWADRERSIMRVRGMLKGDIHNRYSESFLACLKDNFIQWSLKALASLRTTLASHSCSLYVELATELGHSFDPFCETLFINLLKMTGMTKKIIAQQSQAAVTAIITHTSGQPRVLIPLLWHYMQEKNVQSRSYAVKHIKTLIEAHGQENKHSLEAHHGKEMLEKALKKGLTDANPSVREIARPCFWSFNGLWSDRGSVLISALDNSSRKQLEKTCPDPSLMTPVPSVKGAASPKKSSVAAAIAASRAKAKAIATAPPSLRHQATSATHVPGATVRRPSSPGVSRASTSRPSSPLRTSSASPSTSPTASRIHSPPSVSRTTSRMLSSTSPSKTTPAVSPPRTTIGSHSRVPSSSSKGRSESPTDQTATRRRLSSPLALAPTTSPSKRASIIRQTLAGVAAPVGNGHHTAQAPPSPPDSRTSPTPRSPGSPTGRHISHIPTPVRHPVGDSLLADLNGCKEDSLLLAQAIPIPEDDSDSDEENLLSFSAPFEIAKAEAASRHNTPARRAGSRGVVSPPRSISQARSISPRSVASRNRPLSPSVLHSQEVTGDHSLVIEDALRATAEQAESAAERLLEELVDPEDTLNHSMIPPALIPGSTTGEVLSTPIKAFSKATPANVPKSEAPSTPVNRNAVMQQAALFKNSPAYNGRSSSLFEMLGQKKQDSVWWMKRKSLLSRRPQQVATDDRLTNLQRAIASLENGTADIDTLQKLTWLCLDNPTGGSPSISASPPYAYPLSPSPSSSSAPSLVSDIWEQDRNLDKLFTSLFIFLQASKSEELLEYGLMVVWQLVESQPVCLEGHEAEIFTLLLNIRYCNKANVLEATNQIRDSLAASIDAVYGLTTMHASLKAFQMEPIPSCPDLSPSEAAAAKTQTIAFGLLALGRFIVRLPAEILEEELPRLRPTLVSCLNETSAPGGLVVREAAAAAIIAAQVVLKDEGNLFVLLDGLRDDKKNLLTYLFDKHGVRGSGGSQPCYGDMSMEKLEREMKRLDTRTSTPSRVLS